MMKRRSLFILVSLLLFASYACNETSQEVIVLDDFESSSSIAIWNGTLSLSKEFPAHGKSCLELNSSDGRPLWMESEKLPKDWSPYETLKFDIYNPSSQLYYGYIQICDEQGTDEEAEFHGQSYKWQKVFLNTGWNHFEFLLQNAMVEEGDRSLALDKIRKFRLSFGSVDHSLYIDNIRLVAGEEGAKTASHIDPRDCRIVIDNRYVYPTLAGPIEKIKPSPEIKRLRAEAEATVDHLEKEIKIAELQGFQTLYQRIPLITADIGLRIRSKLVWFQSEKEETEILKYIIASCSEASNEIEILLSAQKGNIPILAPENETTSQVFYVPPYPPFNELKPVDGFYRDREGKPVHIFSMLQINKGPLMDYFAPFNHRLESYTVGGGSRYNIESSPVYDAFHNDSGTHRVGWDGWCGHLIKDRWAMGGLKEDVVICLESPHIRQAILEFMKMHSHEWEENPDLLYNIMAYELQYICYCEKSQQMFRDWLKIKHKNISVLNKIWDTQYQSFAQIKAPATHNARPVDDVNRAAWYDWACFNTRRFTDYLTWIKSEMRKFDQDIPICAGGTSSMLLSSNSTSGIDEEMIINEVDDVILNESGSSTIFSDLLLSLSDEKRVMVDPEMGGGAHGVLLQFLHGKSAIAKWWWANAPSREYLQMNQSSLPHSKNISLADINEVLRIGLDVRRLSSEIAAFTQPDPEVAILYSKTSIVQVPPPLVQAGRTPYIDAVYSVWEGSRFLGCRIGFVSEKQILAGKLARFKLLLVPAAKYIRPEVIATIVKYIEEGGTAVIIPESFIFDQYARENNRISEFGITITDVTLPPVIGEGQKVQNYDQSFSQSILYGEVQKKITALNQDIFKENTPLTLFSDGLVQSIDPGPHQVLARFDDGNAAIVLAQTGSGALYYLAAPLKTADYHKLLSPLARKLGLKRPVTGIDQNGKLVTGVEVRAVERETDYLVYASNLTPEPVEFDLKASGETGVIIDLRSLHEVPDGHVKLGPYQETIYKVNIPR
ncbi:MAG: beta-galactosidase [Methanosarcinaceae archaeon]